MNDIDTLVLCGGGISGISYVGVFETLFRDLNFDFFSKRRLIKNIIGVSVGAIFGLMVTCGFNHISEMQQTLNMLTHTQIMDPDPITFVKYWGADTGQRLRRFLCQLLERKRINPTSTFAELQEITHVLFSVCVTNISKHKTEYLSATTTPDFCVVDAILMSAALPPFFTPILYRKDRYIDGSILQSIPMCELLHPTKTIIMRIVSERAIKTDTLPNYLTQIIRVILNNNSRRQITSMSAELRRRTITVDCNEVTILNFDICERTNKKLLLNGIDAAQSFIKTNNIELYNLTRSIGTQTMVNFLTATTVNNAHTSNTQEVNEAYI